MYDILLPIQTKWFNMILSGEKKEEYRAYKPFWTKRVENACMNKYSAKFNDYTILNAKIHVGYKRVRPTLIARCKVFRRKGGNVEWGAKKDEEYWVFEILEILETENI